MLISWRLVPADKDIDEIEMRRRDFITLSAAQRVAVAARAQQKAMPVVGYLHQGGSKGQAVAISRHVPSGTERSRYVEGQNLAIEYRWARTTMIGCQHWAADLVGPQGRFDSNRRQCCTRS